MKKLVETIKKYNYIGIRTLCPDENYGDGRRAIIAGDNAVYGDDPGEIIIRNAVVLHIKEE